MLAIHLEDNILDLIATVEDDVTNEYIYKVLMSIISRMQDFEDSNSFEDMQ